MPTAAHTSIASVAWGDLQVRVYTQDPEGYIRQSRLDTSGGGEWHGGEPEDRIFLAKPQTPLAACCVLKPNWRNPNIHVFWVDTNHILRQQCCTDGRRWYRGDLSSRNIRVHHQSKLAACAWLRQEEDHIRVYYQADDATALIHEWVCKDSTWTKGATLPAARIGSCLASCCHPSGIGLWVFYQTDDGYIRETLPGRRGWSTGMFLYSGQVGTPLAALCTSSGSRVYMSWPAGEIVESVWDGKRWSLPFTIAHGSTRSNVSVCFSNAEEKHIRGYFQNDAGAVIEKCVNADTWPKKVCD